MALIDEQNKLNEMFRKIPDQSDALDNNISQLQDIRDELNEQASAVEDAVCGVAESNLTTYLSTTKLSEIQLTYPTAYLVFGGTYGTIDYSTGNITDWNYYVNITPTPPPILPPVPTIIYSYTPGDDPQIDQWVNDYAYGNELLTKPLDENGTYGIYAQIANTQTGIDLITANKNKLDAGADVYTRYIP